MQTAARAYGRCNYPPKKQAAHGGAFLAAVCEAYDTTQHISNPARYLDLPPANVLHLVVHDRKLLTSLWARCDPELANCHKPGSCL